MPSSIERKLAAIMFTDIVGFTKIMGDDETTALSILENQQSLINPIVEQHKGKIIKKMGDGLLIEFPSTVEAVECATQMQDSIKSYNKSDDNIEFHIRIGLHLGDVVVLGDDILGDGVNIASRIEPLASPDGICITDAVYQSVKSKLKLDAKRIDEVDLKNIDDKYTIYKIPEQENNQTIEINVKNNTDQTKIRVIKYEILSRIFPESIKSISQGFIFTTFFLVGWNFIYTFIQSIDYLINNDSTFFKNFHFFPSTLYEPQRALFFTFADAGLIGFIVFLLGMSIFLGLFLRKKEEKISFGDIRNVDTLLDYMITDNLGITGKYEVVEKSGNSITYYPYNPIFIMKKFEIIFNWILFKIIPSSTNFETLTLVFDGNTVNAKGVWHSINKLKKRLKILELL